MVRPGILPKMVSSGLERRKTALLLLNDELQVNNSKNKACAQASLVLHRLCLVTVSADHPLVFPLTAHRTNKSVFCLFPHNILSRFGAFTNFVYPVYSTRRDIFPFLSFECIRRTWQRELSLRRIVKLWVWSSLSCDPSIHASWVPDAGCGQQNRFPVLLTGPALP